MLANLRASDLQRPLGVGSDGGFLLLAFDAPSHRMQCSTVIGGEPPHKGLLTTHDPLPADRRLPSDTGLNVAFMDPLKSPFVTTRISTLPLTQGGTLIPDLMPLNRQGWSSPRGAVPLGTAIPLFSLMSLRRQNLSCGCGADLALAHKFPSLAEL